MLATLAETRDARITLVSTRREIREVEFLEESPDRPEFALTTEAILAKEVVPQNERFLRTFHPALRSEPSVFILHQKYTNKRYWVILCIRGRPLLHTHVGGLEILIQPWFRSTMGERVTFQAHPDPIDEFIDTTKFLTPVHINIAREYWPEAVGIRILRCLLIRGLELGFALMEMNPSTLPSATLAMVETGDQVRDAANPKLMMACIGLKLRLPGGQTNSACQEVLTTVTHGFVKEPVHLENWIGPWLKQHYVKIRSSIRRFLPAPLPQIVEVQICETKRSNRLANPRNSSGPLGRVIALAATGQIVGTITTTFDRPSHDLPFPARYRHDLSLITNPELIDFCAPPGVNIVPEWANAEDALGGQPVFCCMLFTQWKGGAPDANKMTSKRRFTRGSVVDQGTRQAMIDGAQYHWDKQSREPTTSLLWTTLFDSERVLGWSGSLLCLGTPHNGEISRPLLFQNFEFPWQSHPTGKQVRRKKVFGISSFTKESVKGGFLLPAQIRNSRILLEPWSEHTRPVSYDQVILTHPAYVAQRAQVHRQQLTDPA
ncbi:hypothetical protein N7532_002991 [Penicillium argentinense]|uniref:Uncharacterized protein n=1 Tax=Penicillium argentinense TaxID=1131581 RepID=A0A9W9FLN0_9EURO|nr:uncharacterized protein N7532_002991 [Penicillium argentinense]KAJ5102462.1 hypothetical protein N7532_002991 [Penicillium argentinense]